MAFREAKKDGVRWVFVRVNAADEDGFKPRPVLRAARLEDMPVEICGEQNLYFDQDLPADLDTDPDDDDPIEKSGGRYIHANVVEGLLATSGGS